MIDTGDRILDLPLALGSGRTSNLSDYAGRWLVMYFYPKDNTPGCTTEGIEFNAVYPKIRKAGGELLGVSAATINARLTRARSILRERMTTKASPVA